MAFTYQDFKIIKVEKLRDIKGYDHYTETVYADGHSTRDYKGTSYDTLITTNITLDNSNAVSLTTNLAIQEGWTVRAVFENNEHIYDICLENNIILWRKKISIPEFSIASKSLTPELAEIIDLNKNTGDIYYRYDTTKKNQFIICYNEKSVKTIEKISMVKKDGSSYVSTRVYYHDNTSDYFDFDFGIKEGWHIRSIYYGFKKDEVVLRKQLVIENNYSLFTDRLYTQNIEEAISTMIIEKTNNKNPELKSSWRKIKGVVGVICVILFLIEYYGQSYPSIKGLFKLLKHDLDDQNYNALLLFPGIPLLAFIIAISFIMNIINDLTLGKRKAKKWLSENLKTVREIQRDYKDVYR